MKLALRLVAAMVAGVFLYGLGQTQPWAHPAWTPRGWERFVIAMCATAVVTLGANRYWFYGIVLAVACSVGIMPLLGLGFVLLGALNLGWLLFREPDDRLNLLAGFACYVWLFSLAASFPVNTVWLWGALLAVPIVWARRFVLPLPAPALPVALPLVANFMLALKPEVSADGLSQHFAIVQWVRDHGRFHFDAANQIWAVQPMAGDWALTLAGLLGGESAARLLNYVWLLLIVSFVYRTLRRRLDEKPAALLTGLLAATPLLQLTSTSMFIENFWTALIVGALLAIDQGDIMLAAALAGASGASKLLGLTPAPILGLFALWKRPRWKVALAAVALFVGIAAVPYVRAFVVTGNPVFHYANAVFKSPLLRSDVSFADPRYPARLDWHTLYDVTFRTDLFVESEPGTAGYQWLWFLPLVLVTALFGKRGGLRPIEWTALATALFMVILVFSKQASLRYVEAAMPLLTIAFAPAAVAILQDRFLRPIAGVVALCLFALNLFQMPASGGYHRDFALMPFSEEERDAYLTRLAPARKLVDEMNRRAPGAAVAFLDGDEVAGLRGPVWTSTWHTQHFADRLLVAHSVADYVALLHDFHVDYLIAPGEGHARFIDESALKLFLDSSTDRLAVSGDLQLVRLRTNTNPTELPPAAPGVYDDSNARVVYIGPWFLDQSFPEPIRHTISYSSDPAAALRFRFTGNKITYFFTKAFNRGRAAVTIDGVDKGVVDEYSAETRWRSQVTFDQLGDRTHTIVIRHAGPAGRFIDLDQFVVEE